MEATLLHRSLTGMAISALTAACTPDADRPGGDDRSPATPIENRSFFWVFNTSTDTLTKGPVFTSDEVADMSLINTPPRDRLPIHTELCAFSKRTLVEAILREVHRGGQVFFVHNRVRSIHSMRAFLERMLPGIRFAVAHGQDEAFFGSALH